LIKKTPSTADGRQSLLRLTAQGRKAFAPLDARSRDEVRGLLGGLPAAQQGRLIDAMGTIGALLGEQAQGKAAYLLRPHQPGDMGWVVHRHGVLYAQEYGYDVRFEALVAGIVARFVDHFDARRERCWIAEKDGVAVGCIFLVQRSKRVAQLRLLLVEPSARGLGIGARLVAECVAFARQAGYRSVRLWTQRGLDAARHVYEKAGFRLIEQTPHTSWGHKLVAQVWELRLPA
jgi:N-acetylglutamate synthase-like GNAT family acetyltransferase